MNRDFLVANNECQIRQCLIFVEFDESLLNRASVKFCVELAFLFLDVQPVRKLDHRGIWRRGDIYVYFHSCPGGSCSVPRPCFNLLCLISIFTALRSWEKSLHEPSWLSLHIFRSSSDFQGISFSSYEPGVCRSYALKVPQRSVISPLWRSSWCFNSLGYQSTSEANNEARV